MVANMVSAYGPFTCERPRPHRPLPARGDAVPALGGLGRGADDSLVKPFNPRELVARVRAILRRTGGAARGTRPIEVGPLRVDPRRREAYVGSRPLGAGPAGVGPL